MSEQILAGDRVILEVEVVIVSRLDNTEGDFLQDMCTSNSQTRQNLKGYYEELKFFQSII